MKTSHQEARDSHQVIRKQPDQGDQEVVKIEKLKKEGKTSGRRKNLKSSVDQARFTYNLAQNTSKRFK